MATTKDVERYLQAVLSIGVKPLLDTTSQRERQTVLNFMSTLRTKRVTSLR